MSHTPSFYWFDYETFGTHPAWDRPCQFAGIRTDMDLNEIGQPMTLFCRQTMDYLPHPAACVVTGLSPQAVNQQGVSEKEFIQRIVEQIAKPGTCSLGYNSIRFDDEFTRHTLFRNFHDAYEYEYKDGNSRWDLLDIVRLTRALRPEGIQWPVNDDGSPSNRLEHLSAVNSIEHGQAHDALSDVRATIGMARLIRQMQPRLFDFAFQNRTKLAVGKLLETANPKACLQVSGMIPATRSHLAVILPLTLHTQNRNGVIVLDLHQDPSPLLDMSADEIARALFQKSDSASGPKAESSRESQSACAQPIARPGLRTVQINKCPVIVPLNTLRDSDAERLGIDMALIQKHEGIARKLLEPDMKHKLIVAMTRNWDDSAGDVEGSLYGGGFFSADDRQRTAALRQADPQSIIDIAAHFDDRRLTELARRYQARNHPDSLNEEQQSQWREYCQEKLNDTTAPWLSFESFDAQMQETPWDDNTLELKNDLLAYRQLLSEPQTN